MSDEILDDVLNGYPLEKKDLDCQCSKVIILRVANKLVDDWYMTGRALYVDVKKLDSINVDLNLTKPEERSIAMLDVWVEQYGTGATCLKLIDGLLERKKRKLVEIVCKEVVKEKGKKTMVPPGPSLSGDIGSSFKQGNTHSM